MRIIDALAAFLGDEKNKNEYALSLLERLKPEHGEVYSAALLLKTRILRYDGDLSLLAEIYDELIFRVSKHAEIWEKEKTKTGKISARPKYIKLSRYNHFRA